MIEHLACGVSVLDLVAREGKEQGHGVLGEVDRGDEVGRSGYAKLVPSKGKYIFV